jgi:hypothetical protein
MRARKVEGDVPDVVDGAHWVVEFRIECLTEIRKQVDDYGIIVQSFDVMDRELYGALGKDLEKQSENVLQNQIEASQVQLKNAINTEEETGLIPVEQVQAQDLSPKTSVSLDLLLLVWLILNITLQQKPLSEKIDFEKAMEEYVTKAKNMENQIETIKAESELAASRRIIDLQKEKDDILTQYSALMSEKGNSFALKV